MATTATSVEPTNSSSIVLARPIAECKRGESVRVGAANFQSGMSSNATSLPRPVSVPTRGVKFADPPCEENRTASVGTDAPPNARSKSGITAGLSLSDTPVSGIRAGLSLLELQAGRASRPVRGIRAGSSLEPENQEEAEVGRGQEEEIERVGPITRRASTRSQPHSAPIAKRKRAQAAEVNDRDGGVALVVGARNQKKAPIRGAKKSNAEIVSSGEGGVGKKRIIEFCTTYRHKGPKVKGKWGASKSRSKKDDVNGQLSVMETGFTPKDRLKEDDRPVGGVQLQNVNGRYVVVASSVEVGGRNADDEQLYEEVHEDASMTATSNSFTEREKTERWSKEETRQFFKSLQQCGTDFSIIEQLFPSRTRKQLKNKFKKEEKLHPELVALALKASTPLDMAEFEQHLGAGLLNGSEMDNGLSTPAPSGVPVPVAATPQSAPAMTEEQEDEALLNISVDG